MDFTPGNFGDTGFLFVDERNKRGRPPKSKTPLHVESSEVPETVIIGEQLTTHKEEDNPEEPVNPVEP
jgi:hypothetical protein